MASDDDLLSQDDIDALTAGLLGGDTGGSSAAAGGVEISSTLRKMIKLLTDQASSVVGTILSKEVEFRNKETKEASGDDITNTMKQPSLVVKNHFSGDARGNLYLFVSKQATAMLADLMMMGDGHADFEEEHTDALSEMLNQVMGAITTSVSSDMDKSVEIDQSETSDFQSDALPLSADGAVLVDLDLHIDGFDDQAVLWVADRDFVESFTDDASAGVEADLSHLSSGGDTPAPSAAGGSSGAPAMESAFVGAAGSGGGSNVFASSGNKALDLLLDIELPITIELGRTEMSFKRILDLGPGSIVEMDRLFGEPVDLMINGKVVARGEVVVVDENFGVRVVSLVSPEERIKLLK
jgi:flagellar motor switch protein FliN/FliY